ncbi:MAG TPA: hypothetical protein VKV23_00865 [Acidimicrobiales bacterium]|nr:hypothetical protein [Acidimicrobiales bacterium]
MHPIEQLRHLAEVGEADAGVLAEEAASALGALGSDRRALLTGARRLLEAHPSVGPLWWLAARLLVADDVAAAASLAASRLAGDSTSDELAASLPSGATVVAAATDRVTLAVSQRPDLEVRLVGSPGARWRRGGGSPVAHRSPAALGEALEGATLALVEARAAGRSGVVVWGLDRAVATGALVAGLSLWALVGEGRLLPEALFASVLARLGAVPPAPAETGAVVLGAGGLLVPAARLAAVVGPSGPATPAVGLARPSCPSPPELLGPGG